ncbi:helix-turn-helix domain-containing protein [Paenibacillus elgii]|uniref:helix-turn-helix domain-containing protein n=1 Tax=Paenibacillus elgii TaxID=189691 RepID=UPI002D80321E|nr:helix-turn-helix domain-containing protein [Paenibacillus elgii]
MFGCARFVFNHFLARWNDTFQETGRGLSYQTCATGLPALKKEWPWLKDADSIALQSSVRSLADAFDRFFRKQNDPPRFKSKRNPVQSYTTKFTNGNIAVACDLLKLPKLGGCALPSPVKSMDGSYLLRCVETAQASTSFRSCVK